MLVLLLNYEFPPLGGGAGNATRYLLEQMADVPGIEIELVTSSLDRERIERFASNITIHFLDIGKKGTGVHFQSNANLLRYAWAARRYAGRLMRQKPFDLTHAFFSIPSGWIARGLGLPYVVSLRGSDVPFYNPRFYWLDRLVFRRLNKSIWHDASRVIANSQGLRNLALRTAPDQEIAIIPNGVDTDCFHPASAAGPEEERPFTVISTSRLIQRKGIGHLVEAFARFHSRHGNSRLLLAGTGDLETPLREQVAAAGLSGAVSFLGRVPHANLPNLYRSADVFVLPSVNEGMSNSVLEAMATGLPILTTDTGGTGELVDRSNGVIIDKGSTESIATALERLAAETDTRKAMGLKSREKAQALSWQAVADEYMQVYRSVMESDKRHNRNE